MAAEIPFEAFLMALETTPGEAEEPTHCANAVGRMIPRAEWYRPNESRGTLEQEYRAKKVRETGEWSAEGPLDVNILPLFLSMAVKGGVTPTTPGGGTNSRLWTFVPTITANDLLTATFWWGDQNNQMWKGAFGLCNELTIRSDASGTDGATMSASGITQWPTYDEFAISDITEADPAVVTATGHTFVNGDRVYISDVGGMVEVNDRIFVVANVAENTFELTDEDSTEHTEYSSGGVVRKIAPVFPAQLDAPLITGGNMSIWLDTSENIGTTEITGKVVSAEHVIPVNWSPKYLAKGPTGGLSYNRAGRNKRQITTRVVVELDGLDQYKLFNDGETVKLRVRHNGPLIEGSLFYYVEVDTYGKLNLTDWGELAGTNRTMQLEIMSQYNASLGASFAVRVQNTRTAL